jgi:group I intron endonuclease
MGYLIMIGIYKITSPSGRVYVGQSIDIDKRWKSYKNIKSCSSQIKLKNSINKYGVDSHIFEIIEECNIDSLNTGERYWQDYYDVLNKGLNCCLTSTNELKMVHSKETIDLLKKINSGENHHYYGKLRPEFTGNKNPFYGKKHSEESLNKIKKNKSNPGNIVLDLQTGIFYENVRQSARAKCIDIRHLENELKKGRAKINYGLIYAFKDNSIIPDGRLINSEETKLKKSLSRKGKKIPKETMIKMLETKSKNGYYQSKIVLNLQTGIFYNSIYEASIFNNITYGCLKQRFKKINVVNDLIIV